MARTTSQRSKKSADEPVFVLVPIDAKTSLIALAATPIKSTKLASLLANHRVVPGTGIAQFNKAFVATGEKALIRLANGTLEAGVKIPIPIPHPGKTRRTRR